MDIAALICEIAGMALIAEKKPLGFCILIAGSVCWFIAGYTHDMIGLMCVPLIFIPIHVRGLIKWRR